MRELDELMLRFLQERYESASEPDKKAFQALLTLPDPELAGYLLNQQTATSELQRVIDQILDRADA